MQEFTVGITKYPVYDRDTETLPECLKDCFIIWKKGCTGSEFYKGEVFDYSGSLVVSESADTVEELITSLASDVFECQQCRRLHSCDEESTYDGFCEDCAQ